MQMGTLRNILSTISERWIFFNDLDKTLYAYSKFDKILLVGDFNTEISEKRIKSFLYIAWT